MKKTLLTLVATLTSASLMAGVIVLEDFETGQLPRHEGTASLELTRFESPGAGGSGSLRATLRHGEAAPRAAHGYLIKDFTTPVDLSAMECLTFSYRSDMAHPGLMLGIRLIDGQGGELRLLEQTLTQVPRANWMQRAYPLSAFESGASGMNLSDVRQMSFHVLNNQELLSDGRFTFEIDDLLAHTATGNAREMLLDGFEGYSSTSELMAYWAPGEAGGTVALAEPFRGRNSIAVKQFVLSGISEPSVVFNLPSPEDFSHASYLKLSIMGDSALAARKPLLRVYLEDRLGNRLFATVPTVAGKGEWSTVLLPFGRGRAASMWQQDPHDTRPDQPADVSSIHRIGLLVVADDGSTNASMTTVRFDEIRLGFEGSNRVPAAAMNNNSRPNAATATPAAAPILYWSPANATALEMVRRHERPTLLYFYLDDDPKTHEFKRNMLEADEFRRAATGFATMIVNMNAEGSDVLAAQYRVRDLPALVVIDGKGLYGAPMTASVNPVTLIATVETAKNQ